MTLPQVSLDDKYTLETGRVFLTGIQALVRLPMMQRQRDLAAGLNTAGFISGYRGSPLGGLDQNLWSARKHLAKHHVVFQPGVNEDLAATALWGSQQVNLFHGAKYDGVFGMWYGKGPGVDRCGDVFRHANAAGTSKHGGVLVVAGDDHAAKSSSLPHQTEHIFKAVMMPILVPANVQEYLDYGLHGWAMSRYSGCWVAFKAVADTVETSASVYVDAHRTDIVVPTELELPPGGLNIRWPDPSLQQEERLLHHKLYAAVTYARINALNRIVFDTPSSKCARLGIITSGKSYLDVRQALDDLGIDERVAGEIGLRLYKVGMVWPLEAEGVRTFARGLEEILVVEEKRQFLEYQLKEELYNWHEDVRPRVVGKFDEKGEWSYPHSEWLLPAASDLTPAMIARAIAKRIARFYTSAKIKARLAFIEAKERELAQRQQLIARVPHYCSGCPHNTSTKVPQGSRALAGIGCHYMATWLRAESTQTFSQMGGEGVPWVGQAPFTTTPHVFANLGDGTYFHSGSLAIRQAVAANVPITYKILYNDAVAMTGGQPIDGTLTVPQITQQLAAEGVHKVIVATDDPLKYAGVSGMMCEAPVRHRDELDAIQRELREYPGVSALIYDQTCAAEKRRRRKRGTYPDPAKRVFINTAVCEGCGDCSSKSNCMSVVSVETEFGRKREIDQSSCNKDYSCVNGFCPSFVTVEGGRLRKAKTVTADAFAAVPEPQRVSAHEPYGILITGVGGTGVVTIGALLGMAAHLEEKGIAALDMAGLAQKGGAVWSHVRIADRPETLHAARIAAGEANLVLGCDIVVTVSDETLAKMQLGLTRVIANTSQLNTSDFVRGFAAQAASGDTTVNRDPRFPLPEMQQELHDVAGEGRAQFIDGTKLATALMGDAIATNLFMLGYAYQKGLIPLSSASILRAVELNAVAVDFNKNSFLWGRRAAHDLPAVQQAAAAALTQPDSHRLSQNLDEAIERRIEYLTAYQDAAYAQRYTALVERTRELESREFPGCTQLTEAVARYYFKVLAIKDEYEVARLYADGAFLRQLNDTFEGDFKLVFHLAPPLWVDSTHSEPRKRAYGSWMLRVFKWLAKLKGLRGTALDIFGRSEERRQERALVVEYEALIDEVLANIDARNYDTGVLLARLPEHIRGYGPVKQRYLARAQMRKNELLNLFHERTQPIPAVAPARGKDVVVLAG